MFQGSEAKPNTGARRPGTTIPDGCHWSWGQWDTRVAGNILPIATTGEGDCCHQQTLFSYIAWFVITRPKLSRWSTVDTVLRIPHSTSLCSTLCGQTQHHELVMLTRYSRNFGDCFINQKTLWRDWASKLGTRQMPWCFCLLDSIGTLQIQTMIND